MEGQVIRIHPTLKFTAAAVAAAVLAACSGTGTGTTPPTSGGQTAQATYPRTEMGTDGHVIQYFYNKQIELSGRVSGPNGSIGDRTPMSMITGAMNWGGGPVQTAPKVYVVLWGNWSTGDPDGVANYYQTFIKGVGGSQWMSSQTQYCEPGAGTPCMGNAGNIYVGTWNDTADAIPTRSLTGRNYQSYLASEAQKAEAHFGDNSVNASYVIMLPHGVKVNGFGTSYCAWHSTTSAGGGTIAYTNLPYIPDAGGSCGVNSVNANGTDDGVSIVGGHEQAETQTDPQPRTGWADSSGNEDGDKCAWYNLADTSFSTGTFATQPLWSNSANNCVQ